MGQVRRVTLALALLATLAAVAAAPLVAAPSRTRPPTPREKASLIGLVRAYVESICCDGVKRIKIDYVVVSTFDPRWAEVGMQAWDKQLTYLGGQAAVLHRALRTGKWSLRYFGSDGVLCEAPPKVRHDLQLGCR